MNETLLNLLRDLLYVVVIGVIPIVTKYATAYLDAKKAEIEESSESDNFSRTLESAIQVIRDAVDTTSQTYVDALKKAGNFTEESQKIAFSKTFETVKALLDEETKTLLETAYTDLDKWIEVQVESYIKAKKE